MLRHHPRELRPPAAAVQQEQLSCRAATAHRHRRGRAYPSIVSRQARAAFAADLKKAPQRGRSDRIAVEGQRCLASTNRDLTRESMVTARRGWRPAQPSARPAMYGDGVAARVGAEVPYTQPHCVVLAASPCRLYLKNAEA